MKNLTIKNSSLNSAIKMVLLAAGGSLLGLSMTASATISISEMLIDAQNLGVAGSADANQEFVEFASDTGGVESLAGLHFIIIEGDAPSTGEGVVDVAIDLGALSTGTNGLLLVSDGNSNWNPSADAATVINVQPFTNDDGSGDDIENGSATYAIVSGYTGTPGQDLDTNDDGILDATPWTAVVDVVGWLEAGTNTEISYAVQMGGVEFDSDVLIASIDAYVVSDGDAYTLGVLDRDEDGGANGPYELVTGALAASATASLLFGSDLNSEFTLTPGSANDAVLNQGSSKNVPAMGALGLGALFVGLAAVAARLRRTI